MVGRTPAKSVEQWLISLDSSLSRYVFAYEFRSLDYCNTNSIKYFVTQEFDNFKVKPSNAHRRMILNAVAKMQTPTSRLGLDPPSPKTNGLAPRRLDYSSDGEYGQKQDNFEFVYKSPVEIMMGELEDNLNLAEVEFSSVSGYVETLKLRYSDPGIPIDKTRSHLRDGHNRNRCMNGECEGPESCNDLDKHPVEKIL